MGTGKGQALNGNVQTDEYQNKITFYTLNSLIIKECHASTCKMYPRNTLKNISFPKQRPSKETEDRCASKSLFEDRISQRRHHVSRHSASSGP